MARRKKGRAISGWVIVDKPAGPTSTAVVNKVRWAFDAQKAGHAGTLDPAATGVLAVALGEATKTITLITDALKSYDFTIRFGASTTTDDAEGEVLETSAARPSDEDIKKALSPFIGDILQVPPQFSAVHVDGERAYDKARAGEAVEIAPRPLYVDELTLVDRPSSDEAVLNMVCGKGGYVRSIARDLGQALGCLGHVQSLRRVWSGPFDGEDAARYDDIERLARQPELDELLQPIEAGLADIPAVSIPERALGPLRNGNPAEAIGSGLEFGATCWAHHKGTALAIGTYRGGTFQPSRVLVRHG